MKVLSMKKRKFCKRELGLLDKVLKGGWKNLSAKETGRIGGLVSKKKKELKEQMLKSDANS